MKHLNLNLDSCKVTQGQECKFKSTTFNYKNKYGKIKLKKKNYNKGKWLDIVALRSPSPSNQMEGCSSIWSFLARTSQCHRMSGAGWIFNGWSDLVFRKDWWPKIYLITKIQAHRSKPSNKYELGGYDTKSFLKPLGWFQKHTTCWKLSFLVAG